MKALGAARMLRSALAFIQQSPLDGEVGAADGEFHESPNQVHVNTMIKYATLALEKAGCHPE